MDESYFRIPIGARLLIMGRPGGFVLVLEGEEVCQELTELLDEPTPGQLRIVLPLSDLPALAAAAQRIFLAEMVEMHYKEKE